MAINYTSVTEVPGLMASREQLAMLYTRYAYAAAAPALLGTIVQYEED